MRKRLNRIRRRAGGEAPMPPGVPGSESAAVAEPTDPRPPLPPKPDQAIAIRIDYISRFVALARKIERRDREIIVRCVLDGAHPSRVYGALQSKEGFAHLRDALDRLHSALG